MKNNKMIGPIRNISKRNRYIFGYMNDTIRRFSIEDTFSSLYYTSQFCDDSVHQLVNISDHNLPLTVIMDNEYRTIFSNHFDHFYKLLQGKCKLGEDEFGNENKIGNQIIQIDMDERCYD